MKRNVLTIRMLYNVEGQVFNVDKENSKTRKNAVFNRKYGFASADNIKRNIREVLEENMGVERPKSYFFKDMANNVDKDKQSFVYTDTDLNDGVSRLLGLWNPKQLMLKKEKYEKCSLKSIINISDMLPLHPLLVSLHENECGSRNGTSNDSVAFTGKNAKKGKGKEEDEYYLTPEELSKKQKKSLEDAIKMFNEVRPFNFYEKNKTSSGIYYQDFTINLNEVKYVDISNWTLTDEEKGKYVENGYGFTTINGKDRLVVPTETAVELFKYLVDALFDWDFSSNNSTHGSIKERLRTTAALNNTSMWQQSTMAELKDDGNSASLSLFTKEEDEKAGVHSFNSRLLKKFYAGDWLEYDVNADNLAKEKIKEIGVEVLENI